ncbi:MAG TPA: PIG-L family deacetylase [Longimicrobium sp.]|nr:PIG-L family deacetylase [Longimicrobium sp.]
MTSKRILAALLAAAMAGAWSPAPARAQDGGGAYRGAAALGLAMRRLGTPKRVLMVGAHPDDEDAQLLARLALVEGADVAYLSLTRGEGGQNGIGAELHEALGLLRTEELLAARRVDGAAQLFTRAFDYGFSKSADEAFRQWPREELLRDVVLAIRRFRPDVVVTVFSGTPRDGHGQHQVSALIAREAFEAAGDPQRFRDQLEAGLLPHRPARLYQSLRGSAESSTVRVALGDLDPLLGRSPFQLAMASRSLHRSQDMGRAELSGPRWGYLRRLLPAEGDGGSLWSGVDTTLSARAQAADAPQAAALLRRYEEGVAAVRAGLNPLRPDEVVPELAAATGHLHEAHRLLQSGQSGRPQKDVLRLAAADDDVLFEAAQAWQALALASGLVLDAVIADARVVPGQAVDLELSLWNGGTRPVAVTGFLPTLPFGPKGGWEYAAVDTVPYQEPHTLAPGTMLTRRFRVTVPAAEPATQPYFLRRSRTGAMYAWPAPDEGFVRGTAGEPFEMGPVWGSAIVKVEGIDVPLRTEATQREVDLRQGELRRPVLVVPAVSVRLDPRTRVLPTGSPRPLAYHVRLAAEQPGGVAGTLRLEAPAGWRVEPARVPVRFARPGEVREVRFTVTPAPGAAAGEYPVGAVFETEDGRRYTRGVEVIDYPHVRARPLVHDARSVVRAFDVRVPQGLRVAYVTGAGEEGPGFLENLGIVPDLLDADDLAEGDLDRYDVIVAGSRAYEVRPDLGAHNARLLEWVERGGTLIVQYNKYELVEGRFTPYPITMARPHGRVSDETVPVRVLDPDHPVFTTPNRITEPDWAGWVQERGLYFADTWDAAYTPLLEMSDPGEAPLRGGLLVAKHGRGTYVYTGLAFFRQFPEGVPGAYRLFANLLALGRPSP